MTKRTLNGLILTTSFLVAFWVVGGENRKDETSPFSGSGLSSEGFLEYLQPEKEPKGISAGSYILDKLLDKDGAAFSKMLVGAGFSREFARSASRRIVKYTKTYGGISRAVSVGTKSLAVYELIKTNGAPRATPLNLYGLSKMGSSVPESETFSALADRQPFYKSPYVTIGIPVGVAILIAYVVLQRKGMIK